MEKRNLKVNYTNTDLDKDDKDSYTFILPTNNYIEKVEIKDKDKKEKENPKNKN